jgi:hypothetical protein
MRKSYLLLTCLVGFLLLVSGCLSVEKKTYTFEFTGKNSGLLTIKFYNILSVMDGDEDVSEDDFGELVTDYIEGTALKEQYPDAILKDKRFFEEDGVLCAEIVFKFDDLAAAKLFQYKDKGPYMYCLNCTLEMETYESSNGSYGSEVMPVVFWEQKLDVLEMITSVSPPDETTVSLLDKYKEWAEE